MSLVLPTRPSLINSAIGIFDPPIPFTATEDEKASANVVFGRSPDFGAWPDGNEMIRCHVELKNSWTNPEPITVSFVWVRLSDNKQVFTHTGTIPTPQSQGFEWWNFYNYGCWIGKDPLEVSGPGTYTCFIEVKDSQGVFYKEQKSIEVTGETDEPAYITVRSNPDGARILWHGTDQNKVTNARIEVYPQKNYVSAVLEGYKQASRLITPIRGETIIVDFGNLVPEAGAFTPFAQLLQYFTGQTTGWWTPLDDFMAWVTDMFGLNLNASLSTADKGLFEQFGLKDKILFFGGPMSIKDAATSTVGKQVLDLTAKDILAQGLKDPKGLATTMKAVPKDTMATLFGQLTKETLGRDAIQTIQRVILDQTGSTIAKNAAKWGGAAFVGLFGLAHTLNFIGFLGEEAIQTAGMGVFVLVSNDQWAAAATALEQYRQTVAGVAAGVDALTTIPVLSLFLNAWWPNTKAAAYAQIDAYNITIKEGLAEEETGSISISTNPTGATVWINDKQETYKTNTVISKLIPGDYAVRIELENYQKHEEVVKVLTGQQKDLSVDLTPVEGVITERAGRIQWEAQDSKTGATVGVSWYINDRLESQYTTTDTIDVVPGPYELRWTAVGYKDYEDTVDVELQVTTKLIVKMEKIEEENGNGDGLTCESLGYVTTPPEDGQEWEQIAVKGLSCWQVKQTQTGRLEVSSNVAANISLGGTETGKKTPASFDITQGVYSLTLQLEGYVTRTTTTLIKAGETTNVSLELQAEDQPPDKTLLARVSINSNPTSAKILVNGVFTQKYTPDSIWLEAGDYEISLTKSGYYTWSTPLRLVEGL